jgi:hypothetical protein
MGIQPNNPEPTPERTDVIPDSYAVYVTDEWVHISEYRVSVSEPDGAWYPVETLDRDNEPKLSLDHATPMPPESDGYWIYSRTYNCELNCE